ncbi:hypothetical protein NHF46_19805 [Arthrobacter alpinus]|nr:hypothetical protein [Arthrobacter alpinus]
MGGNGSTDAIRQKQGSNGQSPANIIAPANQKQRRTHQQHTQNSGGRRGYIEGTGHSSEEQLANFIHAANSNARLTGGRNYHVIHAAIQA